MYYFYGELPIITYLECDAICQIYNGYEIENED